MKKHKTIIRVRYQETDNMGLVYYANYLVWFEVARTEYLRAAGISYRELENKGLYLVVAKAVCEYKSPARYDDQIAVETWVPSMRNSSLSFEYNVTLGGRLLAAGITDHVFVNKNGRPARIPGWLKGQITSSG